MVVVIFLGLAIWKPWDRPSLRPASSPRPSAATVASSRHLTAADYGPFPSNEALLAATTREPVWGIRAIVQRPGGPIFTGAQNVVERWVAVPPDTVDGSAPPAPLAIAQPDDDVAAIGLTTADDSLPLDIHFWRENDGGPRERLAPVAVAGPDAGSWIWLPDPRHRTDRGSWQAGAYEIEALLGPRIVRIVATIPSDTPTTSRIAGEFGQPPFATVLAGLEPGPFVLADASAQSLVGGTPPAVDAREAWLGPAAGLPPVAQVAARQVTGFGRLFAPGEEPVRIDVRPLGAGSSPLRTGGSVVDVEPGHRRAIVAWPLPGGLFPDGLYLVTVSWTTGDQSRSETWAVEVAPSAQASPPNAPLDAMVRWIGLLDRPDNDAARPLVFIADATGGNNECSPATRITGRDPLFGIVVPPGVEVRRLRMLPLDVQQSADIAIRFAPNAIDRLTVVAVPPGGLPVRDYDIFLTLRSADGETGIAQRICVSGA